MKQKRSINSEDVCTMAILTDEIDGLRSEERETTYNGENDHQLNDLLRLERSEKELQNSKLIQARVEAKQQHRVLDELNIPEPPQPQEKRSSFMDRLHIFGRLLFPFC